MLIRCRSSGAGEPQVEGTRFNLLEGEGRSICTPIAEHLRVPFLPGSSYPKAIATHFRGGQTVHGQPSLLVGPGALDEPGVRPPLGGIFDKNDDRGSNATRP